MLKCKACNKSKDNVDELCPDCLNIVYEYNYDLDDMIITFEQDESTTK